MINSSKTTTLSHYPQIAGLLPSDSNIEFIGIRETKQVLWMQHGNNHHFVDLPIHYFNLLKEAYTNDINAVKFLTKIADKLNRQIELFTYYMYGDVDSTPDINNGVLSESENFRDSQKCPSLLWNSKNLTIGDHILTERQLLIIDLISEDLPDKAIAATLEISAKTLDFHKTKLYKAVGVNTKTALLALAFKNKIIS